MSGLALVIVVFGLALIGWLAARMRAATFRKPGVARFTALPVHYGYFVALAAWCRRSCSWRRGASPRPRSSPMR